MAKRKVDIAVISDVHLGTPSCRAREVNAYLRSIRPERLVLNGDLVDLGQYWRNHWPKPHLSVIRRVLKIAARGTPVYYLIGNHDAPLRRYAGMSFGNLHILDRLELAYGDGKRALVLHGDVFDGHVSCPRWVYKLGGWAYDGVMRCTNLLNRLRRWCGLKPVSLAALVKRHPMAKTYIERYHRSAVDRARAQGFDAVVCGHIHEPMLAEIDGVAYCNSGDWVEHCTALEYDGTAWNLVKYVDSNDLDEDDDDLEGEEFSDSARLLATSLTIAA